MHRAGQLLVRRAPSILRRLNHEFASDRHAKRARNGGLGEETAPAMPSSPGKSRRFHLAHSMHSWYQFGPSKEETMSADEADKTLKQDLEDTRNDLRQAADEIRVKLHLAGMDAKDAWDEIQPRIEDFERRFDEKADEVSEELKALGSDIKQRLLNIKAKLKPE
jgi:DNA anti-recombination protein RmuC